MVYPGADAEFTLYEDEGNNYNFEKGAYATTKLIWNDQKGELTVEERQGSFDGMEDISYEEVIHLMASSFHRDIPAGSCRYVS